MQQEYAGIMAEMTNVYEEIKLIRERDRSLLEKAKEDILCKLAEIERLKSQVFAFLCQTDNRYKTIHLN